MNKLNKKGELIDILFDGLKTGVVVVTQQEIEGKKMCKHRLIAPQYISYYKKNINNFYNDKLETNKKYTDAYGKENAHKIIWAETTNLNSAVRDASYYDCDYNAMSDDHLISSGKLKRILKSKELIDKLNGNIGD